MLADETGLGQMLTHGGAGDDALEAIRYALDDLVILAQEKHKAVLAKPVEAPAPERPVQRQPEPLMPASMPDSILALPEIDQDEEAPPAFVEPEPEAKQPVRREELKPRFKEEVVDEDEEAVETDAAKADRKRGKKGKRKHRELLYDENRGEVVARRTRKDDPKNWKKGRFENWDEE
jgi:hypothetical protein